MSKIIPDIFEINQWYDLFKNVDIYANPEKISTHNLFFIIIVYMCGWQSWCISREGYNQ